MWNDERLRWTPDEYGGVSMLRVPSKFVWTPDMMQFNTYEIIFSLIHCFPLKND